MHIVEREEHEAPPDLCRAYKVYNRTGSRLGVTTYRVGYIGEAPIKSSWIEAGSYPFPVFGQEFFRITTSVGYGKDRETKLQRLLDHDLGVLFA